MKKVYNSRNEKSNTLIKDKVSIAKLGEANPSYCEEFSYDTDHWLLLYNKYEFDVLEFDTSWYNQMWYLKSIENPTHLTAAIYIIDTILNTSKAIKKTVKNIDYIKLLRKRSLQFDDYQTMLHTFEILTKSLIYLVNQSKVSSEVEIEIYLILNEMLDSDGSEEDIVHYIKHLEQKINLNDIIIQSKLRKFSILLREYKVEKATYESNFDDRKKFRKEYLILGIKSAIAAIIAVSIISLMFLDKLTNYGIILFALVFITLVIVNALSLLKLRNRVRKYDQQYLIPLETVLSEKLNIISNNFDELLLQEDKKMIKTVFSIKNKENFRFFLNWLCGFIFPSLIIKIIIAFFFKCKLITKLTICKLIIK